MTLNGHKYDYAVSLSTAHICNKFYKKMCSCKHCS